MSRSESVTLGTGLIAETNTFASTRIAGTGVATEAHRVYRRAAGGYFDDASASISASTFATSGAKSIPWSSSWIRRASSCGSSRWSHRLPAFPSIRRNLVPGAMPCASRVSFGITILPARSTGTTVVINGIDTIPNISWYRRHESSRIHGLEDILATCPRSGPRVDRGHLAADGRVRDRHISDFRIVLGRYDPHGNRDSSSECMMRSREPIRSPRRCGSIAAARNTEGPGDDASPGVWLRSPRESAEAAQARSPSRRRTSPYESELIRNELQASFSRISRAREAAIAPVSTPAHRRPRRPV